MEGTSIAFFVPPNGNFFFGVVIAVGFSSSSSSGLSLSLSFVGDKLRDRRAFVAADVAFVALFFS